MGSTGAYNALTDVAGLAVGHHTDLDAVCGVTVILAAEGATAGVDVRGSAPGTRETDLLAPGNLVETVQAVVLSGGSVYGLAAADGVIRWLSAKGIGFPLDSGHVAPIVPAAVLYDLGRGSSFVPPITDQWGISACRAAGDGPVSCGCIGAGTGAVSGGIKGGLGTASCVLPTGILVAAIVAVNSLGSVFDAETGLPWEIRLETDDEFGGRRKKPKRLPPPSGGVPVANTTIGLVATDAKLTKGQAQKIAQMAQDGLGRTIRPAHTMFDGDTVFCVGTGRKELPKIEGFFPAPYARAVNEIGHAAADCMSRAIIQGVLSANSLAGVTAFCDLEDL